MTTFHSPTRFSRTSTVPVTYRVFVYWHNWDVLDPSIVYCLASIERAVANTVATGVDCELVRMDSDTGLAELLHAGIHIGKSLLRDSEYALFSDLLRFALLDRYGGIWLDISTIVWSDTLDWMWATDGASASYNPRLYPHDPLLGIENSWLVAPAGQPFIRAVLDELRIAQHNFTTHVGRMLYWTRTGPIPGCLELHPVYHTIYFCMHRVLSNDRSLLHSIQLQCATDQKGALHYMSLYMFPVIDWSYYSVWCRLQGVQRHIEDGTRPCAHTTKLTRVGREVLTFPRAY
jgi:hypothetical protein